MSAGSGGRNGHSVAPHPLRYGDRLCLDCRSRAAQVLVDIGTATLTEGRATATEELCVRCLWARGRQP